MNKFCALTGEVTDLKASHIIPKFFGSSDISSDSFLKRKTAEQIVYLNCDQQMYSYEQQFSISCLGSLYPQMHS